MFTLVKVEVMESFMIEKNIQQKFANLIYFFKMVWF